MMGSKTALFSLEFVEELLKHVKEMESVMHGLTMIDLRRLAFDLAVRANIAHPFANGLAGRSGLGEGIPRQAQHSHPPVGPLPLRAWLESTVSTRIRWRSFSGTTKFYLRKVTLS